MDGFLHSPLLLPYLDPSIEFVSDLDGDENGKPANFQYKGFNIHGNAVVFAAGNVRELKSLSKKQIGLVMDFFNGNEPIPDETTKNFNTGDTTMKDPIKVLVRKAGQEPTVEVIENTLAAKQKLVGGMIEMPYNPDFPEGLQIVCNEEGKFTDDPKPNVHWGDYDIIFGDIFFVGIDNNEGETISLLPKQIDEAKKWIADNDASQIAETNIDHRDLIDVIEDLYADMNLSAPDKPTKKNGRNSGVEM
jgi:hypothetical protein